VNRTVLFALPASQFPFDFRFSEQVYAGGFRPGEQVHITVERAAAAAVTASADANGQVSAAVSFTWVFCGANATAAPPPIIDITGADGAHRQIALAPSLCPSLVVTEPAAITIPGPSPGGSAGTGVSGSASASGSVNVSASATTGGPVTPPGPEPGPLPDPPLPAPTIETVQLTGFGFVPAETVRITEMGIPAPSPAGVTTVADGSGRLKASLRIAVPSTCSGLAWRTWLLASGNRGTVAAALVGFFRPQALPCPVTPGTGTVPPDNPLTPAAGASNATSFGLHVGRQTVRPGELQDVRVHAPKAMPLVITARYAGGRAQMFHRLGTGAGISVRWHVPRNAGKGTASITLAIPTLKLSVEQHFTVA
jgi:hypothetical protein